MFFISAVVNLLEFDQSTSETLAPAGEVVDGRTYILITKNQGMVYKRLNKNKKNTLVLESDNSYYPNFEVKFSEILEIWEYQCNIGRTDKKSQLSEMDNLKELLLELKREVSEIKGYAIH